MHTYCRSTRYCIIVFVIQVIQDPVMFNVMERETASGKA